MEEQRVLSREEFAKMTWQRAFNSERERVEGCYSVWVRAGDERRKNRKPALAEELNAAELLRKQEYYQASEELLRWLEDHPMPAWRRPVTAPPGPAPTDWRRQEKALRMALVTTLKRDPTAEEFEEARSLFHYVTGQFEMVAAEVARERERQQEVA